MAYKIQYTPEAARRYPKAKPQRKMQLSRWIGLGLLVIGILWVRLNGIPDFLIPGDAEVTKQAAAGFVEDIREGMSVGSAVTAFCEEILHGAG